jgi:hypothetical protein
MLRVCYFLAVVVHKLKLLNNYFIGNEVSAPTGFWNKLNSMKEKQAAAKRGSLGGAAKTTL